MNEVSLWYRPVIEAEALGFTVFHGLWQGLLLFFSVQSLLWFFKRARQRYRILYIAFCLLFVSFALTFCMEWKDALQKQQNTEMVVASVLNQNKNHNPLTVPVSGHSVWQDFTSFYQHPEFRKILPFISLFYLTGVFFLTARLVIGVSNTRLLRKRLVPVPDELRQRFLHLRHLIGMRRKAGLFFSEKVKVPLMIGHLKPLVILPVALINQLDMQQTEAILLHELAHIKRRDYLFNLLQSVMELFLFFNPVTWWFAAAIRKERELCCDDVVIAHTSAPVKYAEALFQLELGRNPGLPALAATGNSKKHTLLTRIKRIVEMKPNTKRTPQGIFAALTGLLLLIATGCYYTTAAQEKQQPEQKASHQEVIISKQYQNAAATPGLDSVVNNAMNAAQATISQINWDDVKAAMQQAGDEIDQVDRKTMQHALARANVEIKKAQKQLQNMDESGISNSLNNAEKAIASIDWDEIGDQVTGAIQSADVPDNKTVRDAMQLARTALDSVRIAMRSASIDTRKIADSVLRARRQVADSISGVRKRMTTEALRRKRAFRDETHASFEQAVSAANAKRDEARSEAKRVRAIMSARQHGDRISTVNTDALLSQLESDGRIDRNKKFKISYEDGVLEVNGNTVPVAAYRKYLPSGKNTTLKIAGKKGSLSVSTTEHD